MPTAVVDVETRSLPQGIDGLGGYDQALVLLRWNGAPVGLALVPVRRGRLGAGTLRDAVRERAAPAIWERWFEEHLGRSARDPGPAPASATVAVCTRDRPADLQRCLRALARMPDDGQETLVVDSASATDQTRQVATGFPFVRYVREERPGLDVARNRALREARGEIVAFVDDDAAPDRNWLRALRANFGDPRTLCVTGLTLPIELETPAQEWFERTNFFGRGFARQAFDGTVDHPFRVARIGAGVNMALRRSVLDRVGPFDEALDAGTPSQSGGDHDMFARILLAGYRIVYEPDALSWHRHRREWDSLRRTLFGYGAGVYAFLTAHVLRGDLQAVGIAAGWLRIQLPLLLRALFRRPGSMPLALAVAELRGCAAGPRRYLLARRLLRERGTTA